MNQATVIGDGTAIMLLTGHHREQAARLLGFLEGVSLDPNANVSEILTTYRYTYRYTYDMITRPFQLATVDV